MSTKLCSVFVYIFTFYENVEILTCKHNNYITILYIVLVLYRYCLFIVLQSGLSFGTICSPYNYQSKYKNHFSSLYFLYFDPILTSNVNDTLTFLRTMPLS